MNDNHVALKPYVTGFLLSIILTLTAYIIVVHRLLNHTGMIAAASGLAIVQFVAQAFLFLHLGTERRPRWKLLVFLFMLGVVIILVFGSLWIMTNLNYNMSAPEVNKYLQNQDGL